ncbi:MAG: YjbF family lipoprotein [Pseudomonadota bacterium]
MMPRPWIILCAALSVLVACGEDRETLSEFEAISDEIGVSDEASAPEDARDLVSPITLAEVPTALFIERPDVPGAQSFMFLQSSDGGVETWQDSNTGSVVLERGIARATRGFGDDLMSADISQAIAAVYGDARQALRVHWQLDSENQLVSISYICDYRRGPGTMTDRLLGAQPAQVVLENCADSSGGGFENRYWIDAGGVVRQSSQTIPGTIGTITLVRLKG